MKVSRYSTIALLSAALVSAGATTAQESRIKLPDIASSYSAKLSPDQEYQLGKAFMQEIRRDANLVKDPEVDDYLSALGHRLVLAADPQPFPFTFFIIKDPTINAFAAPGGFIGVHTGLIFAARSEDELAAVLAHEISHVTQHHMARAYEAASKLSLPTAAAVLAAVLLGVGAHNSQLGEAALVATQAGSAQYQINFTRHDEREADNIGMQTLERAGYDPHGMPAFFQRMLKQSQLYGDRVPAFLLDHPVTTARIADSEARADQYPKGGIKDRLTFHLMKQRLKVVAASDPQTLLRDYHRIENGPAGKLDTAQRYGYALALTAAGQPQQARAILERLHRSDPDRIPYRIALANADMQTGATERALEEYRSALKIYPGNQTIGTYYARALLEAGQTDAAEQFLQSLTTAEKHPSADLYRLLAQAHRTAGHIARSHEAMAEYYDMEGETTSAIEQLQLALHSPDIELYDSSRIQARLKELKAKAKNASHQSGGP
ncbi:MAG: M48 family metalloprotease [Gammaproteobacteria bacterium]